MAKSNSDRIYERLNELKEAERKFRRDRKKIAIACPHQKDNGKLKIRYINDRGDCECLICGERFNMVPISENDLKDALSTLHYAIQQIRCLADAGSDRDVIKLLGELDYNTGETLDLYKRFVTMYGKNKKNNRGKYQDDVGTYGVDAIGFIGGKRKR